MGDLLQNPLQCGCDIMWYLESYNQDNLGKIRNAHCFDYVDLALLKKVCPTESCINYDPVTGRIRHSENLTYSLGHLQPFPMIPQNMTICPFPAQRDSYPCSCLLNQDFEMFVNCELLLGQDPHAFFQKINSAFECGGR